MKKIYVSPLTELIVAQTESLLETASPGGNGEYNPGQPIEAKKDDWVDEEEEEEEDNFVWGNVWE